MTKKAIITGITGQDGAYLAKLLLNKNYVVYGTHRRSDTTSFWRIDELGIRNHANLHLTELDLTDLESSIHLLETTQPDEVYNLAAQSFVLSSFDQPLTTAHITGLGPVNLLEAIRVVNSKIRFYQASTSEMFGKVLEEPQNEMTALCPRNPYGAAKVYAHLMTINYREIYDIFGASGILYNHESPLRGLEFVTRKITDGLTRVKLGKQPHIELGNLDAKRDWGYAKDYVEGMWQMLQADKPDTYVLATGKNERVRDFVNMTCKALNIDIAWRGNGINETGIDKKTGTTIIQINPQFYRPTETNSLIGNPEKAQEILGWRPSTTLEEICALMVKADSHRIEQEK